jgi:hypothetical protein
MAAAASTAHSEQLNNSELKHDATDLYQAKAEAQPVEPSDSPVESRAAGWSVLSAVSAECGQPGQLYACTKYETISKYRPPFPSPLAPGSRGGSGELGAGGSLELRAGMWDLGWGLLGLGRLGVPCARGRQRLFCFAGICAARAKYCPA